MLACRQQNDVLTVVDMVKGVSRLGTDADEVPLALEDQRVTTVTGKDARGHKKSTLPPFEAMFFVEERQGYVKVWTKVLLGDTGISLKQRFFYI